MGWSPPKNITGVVGLTHVQLYQHTGCVHWACHLCGSDGSQPFDFTNDRKVPTQVDYLPVLAEAETNHCLTGCNGQVYYLMAQRQTLTTVKVKTEEE